jgi:hypothetical protein
VGRSASIDREHEAAIEAACDLDRGYAARHPDAMTYVRPALRHELCVPGEACQEHDLVRVLFVAPGLRARTVVD